MEGEKVIIERDKLEEMERAIKAHNIDNGVIQITTTWYALETVDYIGKDLAMNVLSDKLAKLSERVKSATFLARLEYLFTKELPNE